MALKKAQKWMLERLEMSDGLGAIYPAILNSIIALRCLDIRWTIRRSFARWMSSRSWDRRAAGDEGLSGADVPHAAVHVAGVGYGPGGIRAGEREWTAGIRGCCSGRLDAVKRGPAQGRLGGEESACAAGGWYFEFNNEFYPDVDDTGQVLLALNRVDNPREPVPVRRVPAGD